MHGIWYISLLDRNREVSMISLTDCYVPSILSRKRAVCGSQESFSWIL